TLRPAGKWPSLTAISGILIGFVGVVLLIGSAASRADAANFAGAIVLLLASLSWSTGSIYGKSAKFPASQLLGTGMQNACRRRGVDAFGSPPRRVERLRAGCCFSSFGSRARLSHCDRFERFCRLRLAFAGRPYPAGCDLCLCQPAGCRFARLFFGTGVDDSPHATRRGAYHRIGGAGEHSAKRMRHGIFCRRPCRYPLPMLEERKFHRAGEAHGFDFI